MTILKSWQQKPTVFLWHFAASFFTWQRDHSTFSIFCSNVPGFHLAAAATDAIMAHFSLWPRVILISMCLLAFLFPVIVFYSLFFIIFYFLSAAVIGRKLSSTLMRWRDWDWWVKSTDFCVIMIGMEGKMFCFLFKRFNGFLRGFFMVILKINEN